MKLVRAAMMALAATSPLGDCLMVFRQSDGSPGGDGGSSAADVVGAGSSAGSGSSSDASSAHHSIFQLSVADIDSPTFWRVFTLMIVFTIAIDRLQARGEYFAEQNVGNQMVWRRVNAELMMFGIVAISIFVFTNFMGSMSEHTYLTLEFVDILCSCGCCGLILVAGILLISVQSQSNNYEVYEREATSVLSAEQAAKEDELCVTGRHGNRSMNVSKTEYLALVNLWKDTHKVPKNFHYHDYLKMCLQRNCCNLMEIHWQTFGILLFICIVGFGSRKQKDGAATSDCYLLEMIFVGWTLCLLHIFMMIHVYKVQANFHVLARRALASGDKHVENPLSPAWSTNTKFVVQNLAFCNSFLMAMFFMHEMYNLKAYSTIWYVFLVLPLVFNFMYALPFLVSSVAWVEAFFVMDPECMEMLMEDLQADQRDIKFIRARWEALGKPELDIKDPMSQVEMHSIFKKIGLHISEPRNRRLFNILDGDSTGTVSAEEMFLMLKEQKEVSKWASLKVGNKLKFNRSKTGTLSIGTNSATISAFRPSTEAPVVEANAADDGVVQLFLDPEPVRG